MTRPRKPEVDAVTTTKPPTGREKLFAHGDIYPGEDRFFCAFCRVPGLMPLAHWANGHAQATDGFVREKMMTRARTLIARYPTRFELGATESLTGPAWSTDDGG